MFQVTCPAPGLSGRDIDSFGRRKREAGDDTEDDDEEVVETSKVELREMFRVYESRDSIPVNDVSDELIQRVQVTNKAMMTSPVCRLICVNYSLQYFNCLLYQYSLVQEEVCVTLGTHQALVASLATACLLLICTSAWAWIVYKKTRALDLKNRYMQNILSYLKFQLCLLLLIIILGLNF